MQSANLPKEDQLVRCQEKLGPQEAPVSWETCTVGPVATNPPASLYYGTSLTRGFLSSACKCVRTSLPPRKDPCCASVPRARTWRLHCPRSSTRTDTLLLSHSLLGHQESCVQEPAKRQGRHQLRNMEAAGRVRAWEQRTQGAILDSLLTATFPSGE